MRHTSGTQRTHRRHIRDTRRTHRRLTFSGAKRTRFARHAEDSAVEDSSAKEIRVQGSAGDRSQFLLRFSRSNSVDANRQASTDYSGIVSRGNIYVRGRSVLIRGKRVRVGSSQLQVFAARRARDRIAARVRLSRRGSDRRDRASLASNRLSGDGNPWSPPVLPDER